MAFFSLHGGATRPDALQFNPRFNSALQALYNAAPPEIQRELGLTSGYRSRAIQQQLWDKSDKTGHTVARPGHSKHEVGDAADLFGFGTGGGNVSDAAKTWVHDNAKNHGLYFPMSYEPWHIQLQGEGGGAPAGAAPIAPAGGVADVMAGGFDPSMLALMQEAQSNPWADLASKVTDVAPRRGGLVGGNAGAESVPTTDPGIPPLETAALLAPPAGAASMPSPLASLFKVRDIGTVPQPVRF